ncbi:hypothetical protein [Kordiimonas sp. SCSIO 12610]|uniref:hypothetical protein n=1 Tax=Kordiimonas sp. SCSIO 12610 TaxID=2829597 RepID=UPI0021095820|nr:hypothetical protein [Kordiimonas sp. SCSIO 12610]UTW54516.1 hypothetical protein KFF44_11970 [Kordiimonas sp. SCSIO 12610]
MTKKYMLFLAFAFLAVGLGLGIVFGSLDPAVKSVIKTVGFGTVFLLLIWSFTTAIRQDQDKSENG